MFGILSQTRVICDELIRIARVDVRLADVDEIRSQSTDDTFDHVRRHARHAQGAYEVEERVEKSEGVFHDYQLDREENEYGQDYEDAEDEPWRKGILSLRVQNILIVAEKASFVHGNPVCEFEDDVDDEKKKDTQAGDVQGRIAPLASAKDFSSGHRSGNE